MDWYLLDKAIFFPFRFWAPDFPHAVIAPRWSYYLPEAIYYRVTDDSVILKQIGNTIKEEDPNSSFTPKQALIATWEDVEDLNTYDRDLVS